MRPKYLEMSAWGPYKDCVKVDFEDFDRGALFLITGPTGSGKTTIFDGICFAIYGNTSGKEREKNTLRSDFAHLDTKTYVKLIFTHNGMTYEVERNPEYLRPSKRKRADGTVSYTKENEEAALKMPDGTILAGVTVVNRKLQELMALDYNQFKQISMIAQGEFDKMLTAPSQEKTKIFRGIFGTEKFDLFTQNLKQRAAELYKKVSEYTHKIEEDISIHARDEAEIEALASQKYVNYDAVEEQMKERVRFYGQEKERLKEELAEKETVLNAMQTAHTRALEQQKQKSQLAQAKERLKKLYDTQNQYEDAKKSLIRAKQAQEIIKEYEAAEEAAVLVKKAFAASRRAKEEVAAARHRYLEAEKSERKAYEVWQQADTAYKRASIGIVADMLTEGEACPVCGSLEHPKPFCSDGSIPDLKQVERVKKLYEAEKSSQMKVYGQVQAAMELEKKETSEAEAAQKQAEDTQKNWQAVLRASMFETEGTFLQAILSKETEQRYTEQVRKWEELVTTTKAIVEHLTNELTAQKQEETDELETAYGQAKQERDELRQKEQQVLLRESRMKEGLASLQKNRSKAEKYRKEYGILKDLENMATGNNAKRLVFEQYVLSSYFEDILAAANVRFRHMTMDRYEMIRKTEVTDARTKDHLDIMIVDYYTGKTRPVSTLSGGERFNASLSLALGMSDVIQAYQGGISVETLFVDEGFGSLDEEVLQAACDTLYQLTQGDKLVGIISHVESLKQRIDNRIEICKTNMGSTLKVVTQI